MASVSPPTIAATATPVGEGALSIVRLSGEDAHAVADRVFRGRSPLREAPGFTLHHGRVVNEAGETVDEVLAAVFRSPHSYTGEDAVEFTCHGGLVVTESVLAQVLRAGARLASPGEFSRRAFLNGKLDLSQAEAVADLIASSSERARAVSIRQLEGKLGARIRELRSSLMSLCALLEIDLDFSGEGLEVVAPAEVERKLCEISDMVVGMADSYCSGRIAREGVSVVLAGKPNAGKSSLFNALLKEERAIVTPHPGTTRDTIEEQIAINGLMFRLIDTAGLRRPADPMEEAGVSRTRASVRVADIVLLVEDGSLPLEEREIESAISDLIAEQKLVVAVNKSDLLSEPVDPRVSAEVKARGARIVVTSATTGSGVKELRKALFDSVSMYAEESRSGIQVTSRRHLDALNRAGADLSEAIQTLRSGRSSEFIALDVRDAITALGEITGDVTSEEILNAVFASFCIGK
jgi:tRNA modification GTPase